MDEQERLTYRKEFDHDHLEYKNLQAELDGINRDLADLDRELARLPEGSPQFLVNVVSLTAYENYTLNCPLPVFLLCSYVI